MAVYMLQTGTAFTIATKFATLDTLIIEGRVTIDNQFFDNRVWGDTSNGMSEYRGPYQAIGSVRAFHDDTAASAVLADFAPSDTGSAISMTFVGAKLFACNAHIHNFTVVGNRQGGLTELSWDFRSIGTLTTVTL